jgi:hypothetical protein
MFGIGGSLLTVIFRSVKLLIPIANTILTLHNLLNEVVGNEAFIEKQVMHATFCLEMPMSKPPWHRCYGNIKIDFRQMGTGNDSEVCTASIIRVSYYSSFTISQKALIFKSSSR